MVRTQLGLGATYLGNHEVEFRVWAPHVSSLNVKLPDRSASMDQDEQGYYSCRLGNLKPGTLYIYELNGNVERPDPASRYQLEGVDGPSVVIDPLSFRWTDQSWRGIPLSKCILYELHIGTFTPQGTFAAAIKKIPHLKNLGVSCVEVMPIAQFSGNRNWGYDGVDLFAVQNSYGGPDGFKQFVNACHQARIAVCLDVVYNHFGPEGNYLSEFGPYFTDQHHTPWGAAINFDGPESAAVRNFFITNALYWVNEYHVDALRLDAVQEIFDASHPHILQELNDRVQSEAMRRKRRVLVIAESDLNDPVLIRTKRKDGYGLDGQWNDDFHHSVHAALTGEKGGYYQDYGSLEDIAKSIKSGFVYDGKFSVFRQADYGKPTEGVPGGRFINSIQNHDQIGNRPAGDRLSHLISFSAQKAAAALLFAAPGTPLLFMGEEYADTAPFLYFVDHGDEELIQRIREGRQAGFATFGWDHVTRPEDPERFKQSKLKWQLLRQKKHAELFSLYQDLIRFRKSIPELHELNRRHLRVYVNNDRRWLAIEYPFARAGAGLGVLISFADEPQTVSTPFQHCTAFSEWINTEHARYGGALSDQKKTHAQEIPLAPQHAIIGKIQ